MMPSQPSSAVDPTKCSSSPKELRKSRFFSHGSFDAIVVTVLLFLSVALALECGAAGETTNYGEDITAGCTTILGNLFIQQSDNLANLSSLQKVAVDLKIDGNINLRSLDGLDNLVRVGGSLWITGNPLLASLAGLDHLDTIGGSLNIIDNRALVNITALARVEGQVKNLTIQSNEVLKTLDGLEKINGVLENLYISGQRLLTSIEGLRGIRGGLSGNLEIFSNVNLPSLDGLQGITSVGNTLQIRSAGVVSLKPLANITGSIPGSLEISQLPITSMDGLQGITGVGGTLEISFLSELTNMTALSKISGSVGALLIEQNAMLESLAGLNFITATGKLAILSNSKLTSFDGLQGLSAVNGDVIIRSNSLTENFFGLENLQRIGGDFKIEQNVKLTSFVGLDLLETVGKRFTIRGNDVLPSLTGLQSLTQLPGGFIISDNDALTSLDGLNPFANISYVLIGGLRDSHFSNPRLSNICALCDANISSSERSYIVSFDATVPAFNTSNAVSAWTVAKKPCSWTVKCMVPTPSPSASSSVSSTRTASPTQTPSATASLSIGASPSSSGSSTRSQTPTPTPSFSLSPSSACVPGNRGCHLIHINMSVPIVGNFSFSNTSLIFDPDESGPLVVDGEVIIDDGELVIVIDYDPSGNPIFIYLVNATGGVIVSNQTVIRLDVADQPKCRQMQAERFGGNGERDFGVLLTSEPVSADGCGKDRSSSEIVGIVIGSVGGCLLLTCCALAVVIVIVLVVIGSNTRWGRNLIYGSGEGKHHDDDAIVSGGDTRGSRSRSMNTIH